MLCRVHLSDQEFTYDGKPLSPRWIFKHTQQSGSVILIFSGPCHVLTSEMVDMEDVHAGHHIKATRMIHILGEFFDWSASKTILLQHLLISWVAELVSELSHKKVARNGNDLFVDQHKLSVSIVTSTIGSSLLHIGINVDPAGAPVAAVGLKSLGVDEKIFRLQLKTHLEKELRHLEKAESKAFPVYEVIGASRH